MTIKWGKPQNPGELRFHTGTLLSKALAGPRVARKQFSRAEITGLYGISIGPRFIGLMTFGKRGFETSGPEPHNED